MVHSGRVSRRWSHSGRVSRRWSLVVPCLPATLCSLIIVSSIFAPFCSHCRSRITEVLSHEHFESAQRCYSSIFNISGRVLNASHLQLPCARADKQLASLEAQKCGLALVLLHTNRQDCQRHHDSESYSVHVVNCAARLTQAMTASRCMAHETIRPLQ